MEELLRFGIVGCGSVAAFHAQAIENTPGAVLTACCSGNPQKARTFAAAHGARAFDTLEELLAGPVDAVCLCTPSGLHARQALEAMAAGKHVVVEKPMSLTLEDADRVLAAARQTGRKVCVISQLRFQPAVQAVRQALDAGAFGRLVCVNLSMNYYRSEAYYQAGGWRGTWAMDGGGALMNQGIHGVDLLRWLMGPVTGIRASVLTRAHAIEVEDTAAALLEFENGAVGTLTGSTACHPGYPRRLEICGTEGSIVLVEDALVRWDLPIPCPVPVGEGANSGAADPNAIGAAGHTLQIANFVDAVRNGTPLLVDAQQGRQALEVVLGVYASGRTGRAWHPETP